MPETGCHGNYTSEEVYGARRRRSRARGNSTVVCREAGAIFKSAAANEILQLLLFLVVKKGLVSG